MCQLEQLVFKLVVLLSLLQLVLYGCFLLEDQAVDELIQSLAFLLLFLQHSHVLLLAFLLTVELHLKLDVELLPALQLLLQGLQTFGQFDFAFPEV